MAENLPSGQPPEQGDMFPDIVREGIGTLVEYAPKVMKAASRGIGDLVRSEPVSPPEFAVSRPTELSEFQMDTEILRPEELDLISQTVVDNLYSDDVVNRLQDTEERAGLFLFADKPNVTDAPSLAGNLRETLRQSLKSQKDVFDKLKYEAAAGIRPEAPLFSRTEVMKNVFNVLRDQIGPQAMSRIGDDRLLNIIDRSVRQSSIQEFAAGGVVTSPRPTARDGIMQYVPYITGARYGS